jgi:hypothetical protein
MRKGLASAIPMRRKTSPRRMIEPGDGCAANGGTWVRRHNDHESGFFHGTLSRSNRTLSRLVFHEQLVHGQNEARQDSTAVERLALDEENRLIDSGVDPH